MAHLGLKIVVINQNSEELCSFRVIGEFYHLPINHIIKSLKCEGSGIINTTEEGMNHNGTTVTISVQDSGESKSVSGRSTVQARTAEEWNKLKKEG